MSKETQLAPTYPSPPSLQKQTLLAVLHHIPWDQTEKTAWKIKYSWNI